MAEVILHLYRKSNLVTNKRKSGGTYEKHLLATWNLGNHLSICLYTEGKEEETVSSWSVARPSEY